MTEIIDFNLANKGRPRDPRILLDPGPPRALYKVNPRLILGQKWWDEVRSLAYKSTNNSCAACGKRNTQLEAHEMYKIDTKLARVSLVRVVPLCYDCHSFIHRDLHRGLLSSRKMTSSEVSKILAHGKRLLASVKLRMYTVDNTYPKIPHDKWRLIIDGNEFAPLQLKGDYK